MIGSNNHGCLPRPEIRSELLSYRIRGKEDSDPGGYSYSRIITYGQGYNDPVIPRLFTPYSKILFLKYSISPQ